MKIADTERLTLRTVNQDDAAFYLALVNDPDFLAMIGDRGIRDLEGARAAIASGPVAMQAERGHSLYLVTLRAGGTPIGMCGLIKRDTLEHVDIGYAFLPAYRGQGYAIEAGRAVLAHAAQLGITTLQAIISPGNAGSIALVHKLGMHFERTIFITPDGSPTELYEATLTPTTLRPP